MNKAIREWFDWRGWVIVASTIVILVSLLAILSPGFRSLVAHPATAGWAAAIATSVAAGVALYVSTSTISAFRMQQRDREEIEISVHALVAPELGMALITLGKYPGLVEQLAIAQGYENQLSAQAELEAFSETLQLPAARDSIEKLHYLSAGKGRNVAYAIGLVPTWRDKVHMLTQYGPQHAVCMAYAQASVGRAYWTAGNSSARLLWRRSWL